jgi:hypothetical protein
VPKHAAVRREAPWLFFDFERDPLEMKNLAGEPARQAEIGDLKRWLGGKLQRIHRRMVSPLDF